MKRIIFPILGLIAFILGGTILYENNLTFPIISKSLLDNYAYNLVRSRMDFLGGSCWTFKNWFEKETGIKCLSMKTSVGKHYYCPVVTVGEKTIYADSNWFLNQKVRLFIK